MSPAAPSRAPARASRAPAPAPAPARGPRPAPAPAPRRPRLRAVDPAAVRQARRVRSAVWLFAIVSCLGVFAVVAFHALGAQGQVELDRLARRTTAAQDRYEQARLSVAQLAAPQQVAARARALGMVPATNPRYVQAPAGSATAPPPRADARAEDWTGMKPLLGARR